jgi:putative signal transducing protein
MTTRILPWQQPDGQRDRADSAPNARAATGGGDGSGIGPVCIGVVSGPLRAEIARGYLEQAGISVYLQGEAIAGVYGVVTGPLGDVRVFVPAAQAEEAARIFGELDFSDTEAGDTEPAEE